MGNTTSQAQAVPTSNNTQRRQHIISSPRPVMKSHHPPSYKTLYPTGAARPPPAPKSNQTVQDTDVNLPLLRRRNPTLALEPPPPKQTSRESAEAAATVAMQSIGRSLNQYYHDPEIITALTARAIAIAVSTSGSRTSFLAAAHAVETAALIAYETRHDKDKTEGKKRCGRAIQAAVEVAMAAEAGHTATGSWPSNTNDANNMPDCHCCQLQPPPATVGVLEGDFPCCCQLHGQQCFVTGPSQPPALCLEGFCVAPPHAVRGQPVKLPAGFLPVDSTPRHLHPHGTPSRGPVRSPVVPHRSENIKPRGSHLITAPHSRQRSASLDRLDI